jgi:hypothetical protein
MDHQEGDHFHLIQSKLFLLTAGCLDRNDEVPQEMGMEGGEFAFPHGKGKDVGRLVQLEISPVQRPNLSIIDQQEAQLGIRKFQFGQYLLEYPSYLS